MYNRYIPQQMGYQPVEAVTGPSSTTDTPKAKSANAPKNGLGLGNLSGILNGLLKGLGGLDSGDILLLLIVLFLFADGENLELLVAVGVLLLFLLKDKGDQPAPT